MKVVNDHRSKFSNLSNWKEGWNPWPPRCRCVALPTELWSHTLGARSIYWDFGVYATQTEDLLVAVERTCLSLPRYLCLGGNWCSSTPAQTLARLTWSTSGMFLHLLSVLNERSHSVDVIGNVHKMRIKVWMLGKNSRSQAASVWTALVGRSASSVLHHFLFHRRSSASTTWGEGRSCS